MNRRRQRRATPRRRSGLSLIELMVVAVLLSVIGALLTGLLVRQQRFHRAVSSVTDTRARMRDIATILPTDIRSASSAGRDFLTMGLTQMQFRAFVGSSVVCDYPAANQIDLPPVNNANNTHLSAWINPPRPGDVVFLYNDSSKAGNADDSWTMFLITDTTSAVNTAWCPTTTLLTTAGDAAKRRYRLTLNANPNQTQIKAGAPMRIMREVRYSLYQASDGQWYMGYQTCTASGSLTVAGACGTTEVLAGPVKAATTDSATSGLYFGYYKQNGTAVAATADTVAWISVGVRTTSESMRQASATTIANFTGGDSLKFVIGLRNRI